jgi:hypothetical protein
MSFRSIADEITRNGRAKGVEEDSLTDAWNQGYTSMDVGAPFFLYEDGFHKGDASNADILIEAKKRDIIIADIEDPIELLRALDAEFVEIYRQNVEEEIKGVA